MRAEEGEIGVLVTIVQLALADGEELGRLDLVDRVPADAADKLSLGYDDYVLVYNTTEVSFVGSFENRKEGYVPSFSLMVPRMPAMLVTRFPPSAGVSTRRISPEGRLTTRAGESGVEGERKV